MGGIRMRFDFQNRGRNGLTYTINPLPFLFLEIDPCPSGPYGSLWNSFWGVRGSAVCLWTQDNKAISRIGWVEGSISRIGGRKGLTRTINPLTPLFLEVDPLPLPFLPMWVPRGIASGECVGVLGDAHVCFLTQDNKAISRIGWVEGWISRIGGATG